MEAVEVNYTLNDLYAVNFRAWRTYLKITLVLEAIFIAIVMAPLLIEGATLFEAIEWADWYFPLGMAVFLIIFYAGICPLIGYVRSRRQKLLGPNYFSFNDEGVSVENSKSKSLVFWSALKKVVKSDSRLFLYVRPGVALIIPKRALSDVGTFNRLAEEADSRWKAAQV